ncbi:MAG: Uma2 family endonuclease [Candidatus Tectimicrobiota bacterium]
MSEPSARSIPQIGTVIADGMMYVTTAYELPPPPDTSHLITEDETPVDNLLSEKHFRLLTEPLYSSWAGPGAGRPYLVTANVSLCPVPRNPAIVPDVMLSLDVTAPADLRQTRSYFMWEFGKPPDVVIEIVSNTRGGEKSGTFLDYARIGVPYYIIYDPMRYLGDQPLEIYELRAGHYRPRSDTWPPHVGLGLTEWEGTFEETFGVWFLWFYKDLMVLPTAAEQAAVERQRAEMAQQQVAAERQRAMRLAER